MFKNIKITDNLLKLLIGTTVLVNALLMGFSILPDHDPVLYGNIAKHMVLSNDWINLIFNNTDWLDKPHFPFWVTAIFFKLFGITSFSYMLPGFIFYLVGAYYSYLLAAHLFNKKIGLLATLFYVSAAHLMISNIDVKAEAYLLGEIMPACYYWLMYHQSPGIKLNYLLLGAFFTALAMMTKGVFVLVTIFGGIAALVIYNKITRQHQKAPYGRYVILKWLLAAGLSFIFIAPELIALYLQFDAHPEKIVFKQTHVSGIKWFFWDSQIGRFFNNGPITRHKTALHYIFFVHTFLWSFLPWSILFIPALYETIKRCWRAVGSKLQERQASIFLLGSFFPTFIMFSVSSFQLDHYINIILPFAAIMLAKWFYDVALDKQKQPMSALNGRWMITQIIIALLLTLIVFVLGVLLFKYLPFSLSLVILLAIGIFILLATQNSVVNAIVYSIVAINVVLVFHTSVNYYIYAEYDAGYKIGQYLKSQPLLPLIEYQGRLGPLSFHSGEQFPELVDNPVLLPKSTPYYLVIKKERLSEIKPYLDNHYHVIWQTEGIDSLTKPFKVMPNLKVKDGLKPTIYLVIRIDSQR